MTRDYRIYIDDILEAIRRIEKYLIDRNLSGFLDDEMAIDAIVRHPRNAVLD